MKYITIFFFLMLLCGCHYSGELRMVPVDYQTDIDVSFHGYTERPWTTIWIPFFFYFISEGSRESEECSYYDNRYVSVAVPANNYSDNISARVKLLDDILLEGKVIAAQNVRDSVRMDFYFPVSCKDMHKAIFYLMDAGEELLAVTTYYR